MAAVRHNPRLHRPRAAGMAGTAERLLRLPPAGG
jgi:hypothetical protein